MRHLILIYLVVVATICLVGASYFYFSPEPKQSHHVVIFYVCGYPIGLLVTLDPPVWVSPDFPPSDETLVAINTAHEAELIGIVSTCPADVQARR